MLIVSMIMCISERNNKIIAIITYILLNVCGIISIMYGVVYQNTTICINNEYNPATWLIVEGITMLVSSEILRALISKQDTKILKGIFALINIFMTIWGIFGGLILWKKCTTMNPQNIQIVITIAFIIHCISFVQAIILIKNLHKQNVHVLIPIDII